MRFRLSSLAVLLLIVCSTFLSACQPEETANASGDFPTGDPKNGETLFNKSVDGAPACATCHNLTDVKHVGPAFEGFSERAGERVEGLSAEEYAHQSIVSPISYIVPGFSNVMYQEYADHLSEQDIADLVAFLLEQ